MMWTDKTYGWAMWGLGFFSGTLFGMCLIAALSLYL
jgi:hypothetical protein